MSFRIFRASRAVGAAAVCIGLVLSTAVSAQQARKLIYATYIPDTLSVVKADKWFMDEVTRRTNGRITFEVYLSGALLKAGDVLPGVAAGAADLGMSVPSAYNRRDYPLSNITLPYISDKVDSVTFAFKDMYESNADLRKEYESRGLKLLYAPAAGENTIWSIKPIAKPDDIRGLKVRAVLGIGDALAKLGAAPVAIPWNDALEGMQRGVVDAMSSAPFDNAVTGGLVDIAKYGSDGGRMGIYAVYTTVMSRKTYDSLDKETQKVIDQVASEAPGHYIELLDSVMDESAKKVADRVRSGALKIDLFSDSDVDRVRTTVGREIYKEWVDIANKSGYDGQKLLDQFIAAVHKYDAKSRYVTGFERVKKLSSK